MVRLHLNVVITPPPELLFRFATTLAPPLPVLKLPFPSLKERGEGVWGMGKL
jgi:hypothetical protein